MRDKKDAKKKEFIKPMKVIFPRCLPLVEEQVGSGGLPGLGGSGTGGAGQGFGGISNLTNPIVNVIPCGDALTRVLPRRLQRSQIPKSKR